VAGRRAEVARVERRRRNQRRRRLSGPGALALGRAVKLLPPLLLRLLWLGPMPVVGP